MRAVPTRPQPPAPEASRPARLGRLVHRGSRVLLALILALITYVSLSDRVGLWWGRESNSKTSSLPRSVQDVLAVRPHLHDADVHLVLWLCAGVVAVLATTAWRYRAVLLVALVAYGGLLELAQFLTKTRTAQWGDFLGDAIGIVAGAAPTSAVLVVLARHRRAGPPAAQGQL